MVSGLFCASRNYFKLKVASTVTRWLLETRAGRSEGTPGWTHHGDSPAERLRASHSRCSVGWCSCTVALAALTSSFSFPTTLYTRAGPPCLNQDNAAYVHGGIIIFQLHLLIQVVKQPNILLVFFCKLLPTQQIFLLTLHSDAQVFFITFEVNLELTSEQ